MRRNQIQQMAITAIAKQLDAWGDDPRKVAENPKADPCAQLVDLTRTERPLLPATKRLAVQLLCQALAKRWPGQAIELRVPPAAAIQLSTPESSGRHTRGTPANVVETNTDTLLDLAWGRITWDEAVGAGRVAASGVYSDLSLLWPVDADTLGHV